MMVKNTEEKIPHIQIKDISLFQFWKIGIIESLKIWELNKDKRSMNNKILFDRNIIMH